MYSVISCDFYVSVSGILVFFIPSPITCHRDSFFKLLGSNIQIDENEYEVDDECKFESLDELIEAGDLVKVPVIGQVKGAHTAGPVACGWLPRGDGKRIRGQRANSPIMDEFTTGSAGNCGSVDVFEHGISVSVINFGLLFEIALRAKCLNDENSDAPCDGPFESLPVSRRLFLVQKYLRDSLTVLETARWKPMDEVGMEKFRKNMLNVVVGCLSTII